MQWTSGLAGGKACNRLLPAQRDVSLRWRHWADTGHNVVTNRGSKYAGPRFPMFINFLQFVI